MSIWLHKRVLQHYVAFRARWPDLRVQTRRERGVWTAEVVLTGCTTQANSEADAFASALELALDRLEPQRANEFRREARLQALSALKRRPMKRGWAPGWPDHRISENFGAAT